MTPHLVRQHTEYFSRFLLDHGYPPTVREEQEAFGLLSSSSAQDRRNALVERGVLTDDRRPGQARALTVTHTPTQWGDTRLVWREGK